MKYDPNPGGTGKPHWILRVRVTDGGLLERFSNLLGLISYLYSRQVKLLSYLIGRTLEASGPPSYLITSNVWLPICQKTRPDNLSLPTGPVVAGGRQKNDAGIKNKGCECVCVCVCAGACACVCVCVCVCVCPCACIPDLPH